MHACSDISPTYSSYFLTPCNMLIFMKSPFIFIEAWWEHYNGSYSLYGVIFCVFIYVYISSCWPATFFAAYSALWSCALMLRETLHYHRKCVTSFKKRLQAFVALCGEGEEQPLTIASPSPLLRIHHFFFVFFKKVRHRLLWVWHMYVCVCARSWRLSRNILLLSLFYSYFF